MVKLTSTDERLFRTVCTQYQFDMWHHVKKKRSHVLYSRKWGLGGVRKSTHRKENDFFLNMMYLNFSESEDTLLTFWHILIRQQLHIFHDINVLFLTCIFFDVQENEYILLHAVYIPVYAETATSGLWEKKPTQFPSFTVQCLFWTQLDYFKCLIHHIFLMNLHTNIVDMHAKKRNREILYE